MNLLLFYAVIIDFFKQQNTFAYVMQTEHESK